MDTNKILTMHLIANLIDTAVLLPGEIDDENEDEPEMILVERIDFNSIPKIRKYLEQNQVSADEMERFLSNQWLWDAHTFTNPEGQAKVEFIVGEHKKEISEKRRLQILSKFELIKEYLR